MYTLSKLKPDYFYLRTDISDIDKWKQSKDIPQNRAFYQTFSKEIFNKTSKEREKNLTVICPTNGTNYIKNPNLPNERSIKLIEKVLRIRKFDLIFSHIFLMKKELILIFQIPKKMKWILS